MTQAVNGLTDSDRGTRPERVDRSSRSRSISDDEPVSVLRTTYDHLRETVKADEEAHRLYIQKVRHLMTVQLVLFAGTSFGLAKCGWAFESGGVVAAFVLILSGLAALTLLFGFVAGIWCLHVRWHSVVGVKNIIRKLKSGGIENISEKQALAGYAENLAVAVEENREASKGRRKGGFCVNWSTALGALLVSVFVSVSVVGDAIEAKAKESSSMSGSSPESDSTADGQPSQENPMVEPSDQVQQGPNPFVEPSDMVERQLSPLREPSGKLIYERKRGSSSEGE